MTKKTIDWRHNQFNRLAPYAFRNMINDEHFTDVTLATGDGKQIKAHKVILGSSSIFFKNILIQNPHPSPLVYLKDIKYAQLMLIMDFIYLGQCQVPTHDLNDLIAVGVELQVVGLEQVEGSQEDNQDYSNDSEVQGLSFEKAPEREDDFSREGTGENLLKTDKSSRKIEKLHTDFSQPNYTETNDRGIYNCVDPEFRTLNRQYLNIGKKPSQASVKYECDKCDYKAKYSGNLQKHQQSIHDGVKYDCDKCEFKTTQRSNIQRHQHSVHEGVRYKCDTCDYKAKYSSNLRRHQQSVHEGVKYD